MLVLLVEVDQSPHVAAEVVPMLDVTHPEVAHFQAFDDPTHDPQYHQCSPLRDQDLEVSA
jgi:hypothetical protein